MRVAKDYAAECGRIHKDCDVATSVNKIDIFFHLLISIRPHGVYT